jgi:hypothetical protein
MKRACAVMRPNGCGDNVSFKFIVSEIALEEEKIPWVRLSANVLEERSRRPVAGKVSKRWIWRIALDIPMTGRLDQIKNLRHTLLLFPSPS